MRNGASWYKQFGIEGNYGTKTFSLVGKVLRTGLIEVPLGMKLRNVIFDVGGGTRKPFKAVQTGGPSGGCLSEEFLETPLEYESLSAAGSIMGSGGLIVMDEDTCMVDLARYFMNFCAEESCGKCTPCRIGTGQMLSILDRICEGQGREEDIELLERIGTVTKATSLCGLGQTAPNPILSTIRQFRKEYEEHIHHKHCSAGVCQDLFLSPCQNTCPVGMDVPGYISMIAAGRFEEAIRIGRETNPFLSVCGRVCDHPCMSKCRRNELDEPVAIRSLKRFIGDYARSKDLRPTVWTSSEKHSEKIAVIGAGPSGLSCAYFLARLGYPVTAFERLPIAGGMLAVGIPEYRLPKDLLETEIQLIRDLGVEIRTRTTVGRDITVKELMDRGYKAIYAAIGMYGDRELKVPGEDAPQVMQGVDFLTDVSLGKRVHVGANVAVIGGGNTAVDAARTAVRLGSEEVTIVYRRTQAEMPAFEDEIQEAREEGIEFIFLAAPIRIFTGKSGQVTGMECIRMKLGEYDNKGRRRPIPIEGSQFTINADTVIPAIGEFADVRDLFRDIDIETQRDGTIVVNDEGQTSIPGIFAGGDVAVGAATVIKAVAAGERAAASIDRYLRGDPNRHYEWRVRTRSPVPFDPTQEPVEYPKVKPKYLPVRKRCLSFMEVQKGLIPSMARKEAERCLRCDYREESEQ
jgi:NADH-quinone oxidoreductase subunit F